MNPRSFFFHFSDGSMPKFAESTIREEKDNPEDEIRMKRIEDRKRKTQEAVKALPDGAKGPKFSKKTINKEVNRRNATKFGNMTDW